MSDYWRFLLYYPLGLLPIVFFSLRFLIQWIKSEKRKESYVEPLFWKLSLAGNLLFFTHYFIQLQYPFALIQACNAVISWRNLNLMGPREARHSFFFTIGMFIAVISGVTISFSLQSHFFGGEFEWVRSPGTSLNASANSVSLFWHALGFFGQALFASRFWLQWWESEKDQKSELPSIFWWASLIGNIISLTYFIRINDIISVVNNAFGSIFYIRNLMLIKNSRLKLENAVLKD